MLLIILLSFFTQAFAQYIKADEIIHVFHHLRDGEERYAINFLKQKKLSLYSDHGDTLMMATRTSGNRFVHPGVIYSRQGQTLVFTTTSYEDYFRWGNQIALAGYNFERELRIGGERKSRYTLSGRTILLVEDLTGSNGVAMYRFMIWE
jgi:hypothetical protein